MQFYYEGKQVKLQGEHILVPTPLKGKTLSKMMKANSISGFYQFLVNKDDIH